jgi:hypothetical protein
VPSLAAPARELFEGDQPLAFGGIGIGNEVGVGRARTLDNPDAAQKSDPAARSLSALSGPISR